MNCWRKEYSQQGAGETRRNRRGGVDREGRSEKPKETAYLMSFIQSKDATCIATTLEKERDADVEQHTRIIRPNKWTTQIDDGQCAWRKGRGRCGTLIDFLLASDDRSGLEE
jgi:hypothetical protein